MSPRLALVISFSASGRSRLAFASVVTIRPCSNSWVARFARMIRSCEGLPPRRFPLVGVGIRVLHSQAARPCDWRGAGVQGVAPLADQSVLLGLGVVDIVIVGIVVPRDGGQRIEAGGGVLER